MNDKVNKLVKMDVICQINELMEYLIDLDFDNIKNNTIHLTEVTVIDYNNSLRKYNHMDTISKDSWDKYIEKIRKIAKNDKYILSIINKVNDLTLETEEFIKPTEFWIVSERLGKALINKDEPITTIFGLYIWNRKTSGQHTIMDTVIEEIAEEIL